MIVKKTVRMERVKQEVLPNWWLPGTVVQLWTWALARLGFNSIFQYVSDTAVSIFFLQATQCCLKLLFLSLSLLCDYREREKWCCRQQKGVWPKTEVPVQV